MRVTAYHIETGPQSMYPVDLSNAVGSHPLEWSRVPWTDETKAAALPKLKQKREDERTAREEERRNAVGLLGDYDQTGARVVSPFAGQTQQAPAGFQGRNDPHTPPYAAEEGEANRQKQAEADKAGKVKAAEEDVARAQNDLDKAKKDDEKTVAQDRLDAARAKLDDAKK